MTALALVDVRTRHPRRATFMQFPLRLLWQCDPGPHLAGLALAREGGRLLARDGVGGIHLLDATGRKLAQQTALRGAVASCCASDGKRFGVAGTAGEVWLLGGDLAVRWERALPPPCRAVALDSFGDRLAAADGSGGLHLFDGGGKLLWRVECPRPLHHLAFVAEAAVVLGSADFGFVVCFDAAGHCTWRDTPVVHVGSLAASGDGGAIALACYGDGLYCYGLRQPRPQVLPQAAPCRLADVSYDGRTFLTAGLDERVSLRDASGVARAEWSAPSRPVALALSPAADRVVLALANGTIQALATATAVGQ